MPDTLLHPSYPAPVPGIQSRKLMRPPPWIAGTSPAMTGEIFCLSSLEADFICFRNVSAGFSIPPSIPVETSWAEPGEAGMQGWKPCDNVPEQDTILFWQGLARLKPAGKVRDRVEKPIPRWAKRAALGDGGYLPPLMMTSPVMAKWLRASTLATLTWSRWMVTPIWRRRLRAREKLSGFMPRRAAMRPFS